MNYNYNQRYKQINLNCGHIDLEEYPSENGVTPYPIRTINEMNKYVFCGYEHQRNKKWKNKVFCSESAIQQFCKKYNKSNKMILDYNTVFKKVYGITRLVIFDTKNTEWGYVIPYEEVHRFINDVIKPDSGTIITFDILLEKAKEYYKPTGTTTEWNNQQYWAISHKIWDIINEWAIVGLKF